MKYFNTFLFLFGLLFLTHTSVDAQNRPVLIDIEDGVVGADWDIATDGDITYVSISSNGTANNPQNAARVVTVDVAFSEAQTYDLYIRLRVGAGAADDDSFFYGSGFGSKDVASDNDWIRVNNIHSIGYSSGLLPVDGQGGASTEVWKWINLSEYQGDETPMTFTVDGGGLNQTFSIGAREDGLDIDKIAFARADYLYTVENLDNAEPGVPENTGGGDDNPIAEGKPKWLGCIWSPSQEANFNQFWNQVTPENAGKWGSVEGTRDNMNWAGLDQAYNLAKDNGYPFRFHVCVWGNQQPAWIENLPPAEQLEEIEEWMAAVGNRYPDIDFVEVVNEPLHDPPNQAGSGGGNYINALGGTGATGYDWIITAFQMARQHFPNAQLIINDYNIINSMNNVNEYRGIINLLKAQDLIDGIGFQAHAFSTQNTNSATLEFNLNTLAGLGLPIQITEMDIDGPTDEIQLERYERIFPIFWEHPSVIGITLWGYRPGLWREDAFLIENDGVTERPAMVWLRNYVENSLVSTRDESIDDEVSVFPNPITNQTFFVAGDLQVSHFRLIDMSGVLMYSSATGSNEITLDQNVADGIYILELTTERGIARKKVVIYN